MNIVFGIIIALGVTLLGFKLTNKYYLQKDFFDNLTNFLEYLHTNLSFQNDNTINVFTKYHNKNSDLNNILTTYISDKKCNQVDTKLQLENLKYLSQNELLQLNDFFDNYGTTDRETQLQHITSMLEWSKQKQAHYTLECLQKGKMYKTLSVMSGLVVLVIYI